MLKKRLLKIHWFVSSQLGFDGFRLIRSLKGLYAYLKDWQRFRARFTGEMCMVPCLHDRYEEGGIAKGEYFWQDLLVAQWIAAAKPIKHVDIGSRIDGFVAHVASFREIEVFDIRPLSNQIPGVVFKQADLMETATTEEYISTDGYCDSLSCLHAIEHFGLGRYGDPIDIYGHEKGFRNISKLLASGGKLYLSTPIGAERVEFNANWVFSPKTIVRLGQDNGLTMVELHTLNTSSTGFTKLNLKELDLNVLEDQRYVLGIFIFQKN